MVDAYNLSTIEFLEENHSTFDIIIDDGSHNIEDQEFFFNNYWDILSVNGVLICEDVQDESFFARMVYEGCYGLDLSVYKLYKMPDSRLLIKTKQ